MQIVIEISKKAYKLALENDYSEIYKGAYIAESIKKGIPLPKSHGKLKDIGWIYENTCACWDEDGIPCVTWEEIYNAPTILEATEANHE